MTIRPELTAIVGEIDFDPDALHAKYLAERDKRLRDDGIGQYTEVTAEFSHYVDDPYVEPGFTRAPVTDEAMAMERQGHRPLLVEGSEDNLKVTTPADLAWFRYLRQSGA